MSRDTADEKPARMTLGRVIERLTERGASNTSSVTLARNAKGETQIEVVVRSDPEGMPATIEEAELVAGVVFDRLRARYPMLDGTVGAAGATAGAAERPGEGA